MRQLTITFLLFFSALASAADTIGTVVESNGSVVMAGERLLPGQSIPLGARLVSDADGKATLRLSDDSLIHLEGPTDLLLESYVFNPRDLGKSKARYVLHYGNARLVSGLIAKTTPGSVVLNTLYGDITTEGTDYSAGVCTAGCSAAPGLYVSVKSGIVKVSGAAGPAKLGAGQIAAFGAAGGPAVALSSPPAFMAAISADVLAGGPNGGGGGGSVRVGADARDLLGGITDPPASPSQPVARAAR